MTIINKIPRLILGYVLYALGVVFNIKANLGLSPWNVFNEGLNKIIGITIGQSIIVVGVIIVIITSFFKEKIGIGTLGNMICIGLFTDLFLELDIIPIFEIVILKVMMLLLGLFTIGVASYCYLSVELGSGPRDGLMVLLAKRTRFSVRTIRSSIEIVVLIIGYFMGGTVGVGTLISAFGIGYFVQFAFKLFKFDVSKINHVFIDDQLRTIIQKQ